MVYLPPPRPNPVPSLDSIAACYASMVGLFGVLIAVSHADVVLPAAVGFVLGVSVAHAVGRVDAC